MKSYKKRLADAIANRQQIADRAGGFVDDKGEIRTTDGYLVSAEGEMDLPETKKQRLKKIANTVGRFLDFGL